MRQKCPMNILYCMKMLANKNNGPSHLNVLFYHRYAELDEKEKPALEWYKTAYSNLLKLTCVLENVDQIDGRLVNLNDNSTIIDEFVEQKMQKFKYVARTFVRAHLLQQSPKNEAISSTRHCMPDSIFARPIESGAITLKSLTQIAEFLNVSAQKRKLVRQTIIPQVTRQHILRGALEELMIDLNLEIGALGFMTGQLLMGQQIVSSCIKFLADSSESSDPNSPSWMKLAATRKPDYSQHPRTWGDVLAMCKDLASCLRHEKRLAPYVSKLEAMKEGLCLIKDVLLDRDIGYRHARRLECLVQKKLSQSLGHSSECLFTLLVYYLYGSVRNIEVEVYGGVYGNGGRFCLCIGKVLTSGDERVVWSGVKQMDRALRLFKFVWEAAGMNGVLELQGHMWGVGVGVGVAEERTIEYRGNVFFLHAITL